LVRSFENFDTARCVDESATDNRYVGASESGARANGFARRPFTRPGAKTSLN
jgi:hypothetical protein